MNIEEMTDEQFDLYRIRQDASRLYLLQGHLEFAKRIELGMEDHCVGMRLARFFFPMAVPQLSL